jgi:DnaJ-class molecular chaperone
MNLNKNYYHLLGVNPNDDEKVIKKAYYKLSFEHHPDKGGDALLFSEMTEAYDILCSDKRNEYDIKSKFGNNYNEYFELFEVEFDFNFQKESDKYDKFKRDEIDDIFINVDDSFNGTIEFERWVKCKSCDGTGKDTKSKIEIKDSSGKVVKTFDAEDGCDFCEGSGKNPIGGICNFCHGKGRIGLTSCGKCNGEKRILGKQKLTKIKLTGEKTCVESMGNCSKNIPGKVGNLYLVKQIKD